MRRSATKRRLTTRQREPVERSANYLLKYQDYLAYDQYLATGLPIGYAGASLTDAGAHSLSLGRPPGAGTGVRSDPGGGTQRQRQPGYGAGARRDPGGLDPLVTAPA